MPKKEDILEPSIAKKVMDSILSHYGYTPKQLSVKMNLKSPAQLYNMVTGITLRVSDKYADIIVDTFPELNKDWVLTGRGQMFVDGKLNSTETKESSLDNNAALIHLIGLVDEQIKVIKELKEEVKQLKLQVATLAPQPRAHVY